MDKGWMDLPRSTTEYIHGVNNFIEFAFTHSAKGNKILCPCKKCVNCSWLEANIVIEHLICEGFKHGYRLWIFHGEVSSSVNCTTDERVQVEQRAADRDEIPEMLIDMAYGLDQMGEGGVAEGSSGDANNDADDFYRLVDDASQELYPVCKTFARARHEWFVEHGYKPRRDEMYIKTHTRKNGTPLTQAADSIRKLQEATRNHPELREKTVQEGDVFSHVFGREPRGYVRSIGLGPTPSTLGIHGHRKYTPTKVQMAIRGRRKAEQEVIMLKGTVDELRDEIVELKRMFYASQGRETTPNVGSPLERGSNPTPSEDSVDVSEVEYDQEMNDHEVRNHDYRQHVNQQVNDQELSGHAYRQKLPRRRAAIPEGRHNGVDQVSDHEVSNHAYRQQLPRKIVAVPEKKKCGGWSRSHTSFSCGSLQSSCCEGYRANK